MLRSVRGKAVCLSSDIHEHRRPPVPGSGNPPQNDVVCGGTERVSAMTWQRL